MGYEQWWKSLENLIAELRRKHITIAPEIMTSLRSARTMINIYKADTSYRESIPAIENYLLDVESTLINLAKEKISQDFMESWISKLETARQSDKPAAGTATPRFIPGLPRREHWIRVLPSGGILKEDVTRLADELGLSWKLQKDGYILVYGVKDKVKDFVKTMAEKCRPPRKN